MTHTARGFMGQVKNQFADLTAAWLEQLIQTQSENTRGRIHIHHDLSIEKGVEPGKPKKPVLIYPDDRPHPN